MDVKMDEAVKVYCYPVSKTSTYIPLLFQGIEHRYQRVYRQDGSLRRAITELLAGKPVIVHIHWEEFILRNCESVEQAGSAAEEFASEIAGIRAARGTIFWTVHNELPHLIPFRREFLAMRALLAQQADVILVHNTASIDTLAGQVKLDRSKIRLLPHPSYLDQYEDEAALQAGLLEPTARRIQGFGWIRLQKGFGEMIEMLPAAFLASHDASIRISGHGIEAGAVITQQASRGDVHWDIRHVPDAEVPRLLRSAACVVLPYERMLTSGVALLAMSSGAMIVAVDVPQLRELLPSENYGFLYPRGDGKALRDAIERLLSLPVERRRAIIEANLEVARQLHPRRVARKLAALYDQV